jgi:hypothetical protein
LVNSATAVFLFLLVVAAALNLVATVCLLRSDLYTPTQKALQSVLIWVIPMVGAVWVLIVWVHDRKSTARDPFRDDERYWMPGMGPESDRVHRGDSLGGSGHDGHGGDGGGSSH